MIAVEPGGWLATVSGLHDDGYVYFDLLAGVDRIDAVEVLVHLLDPASMRQALVGTRVPAGAAVLPSLAGLYPAAGWHEREAAEMFGLVFSGHPDPRPLLRRTMLGRPPLLRSTVLAARVATAWPGTDPSADRPGRRRRQAPPGTPVDWMTEPSA